MLIDGLTNSDFLWVTTLFFSSEDFESAAELELVFIDLESWLLWRQSCARRDAGGIMFRGEPAVGSISFHFSVSSWVETCWEGTRDPEELLGFLLGMIGC